MALNWADINEITRSRPASLILAHTQDFRITRPGSLTGSIYRVPFGATDTGWTEMLSHSGLPHWEGLSVKGETNISGLPY